MCSPFLNRNLTVKNVKDERMQISILRNRDIRMQENGINERKLEKVREESCSFKRRIICNWKLLKESLTPVEVIDSFISQELVAADLWDYIKNESRRSQMDSILSNAVKNIETSDDYDRFEEIVTTHKTCKIQLRTPRDELSFPVQRRLADNIILRSNRELMEKELYPKDHIDSFLECFILSIEDHEALRNKENVRQQMANSFLQKILEPISIEKGAEACLIESFKRKKELQDLIERRDVCRNSIMSKWTYLKENFYPNNNLIDELCSGGLVDKDRADIINEKPRREQVYSTLRNIIRRIDGPEMFSKLVSILKQESSFIAEKLEETSHKSVLSDVPGAKNCSFRNPSRSDDNALRDNIHRMFYMYKDDIAKEFYPTDVDTFMDKLVFDVDDHEIICETGNDEIKINKACFYDKISDTKYIQKGSLDCLVFCLRNNEKVNQLALKEATKICSGVHGSRKMRILKANRELLEEEYDPMPLLKSVFEENVKKYKSFADLFPQYTNAVFQQFREISKVPERRKRVTQFMDIAEYMIDADTLWELIEDTANAFSVKKLRDDLNDVNSGQENVKLSVACSEEGLVFKGRYEVWITEEDVQSPLQTMILETNRKQEEEIKHLEEFKTSLESMTLETRHKREEDQKHLKDLKTSLESMNLETRQKRDETFKYHPAFLKKKRTKDETIIYRSPSLEELWSEDEAIQYPRLSLLEMREEDRNNDVKLWIKIRMETLSRLDELKDELLEANKKNKRATIARSLTFGLALVGGALFSVYTGGLSVAGSTLITGVFTTGAASIILLIKKYVKGGVLRRTQLGIYEDQTATHHFKIKVLRLEKDNIPFADNLSLRADNLRFADNLRKIKLKGIEDLAKVPLEQLISRFGDTESSSLLTAVDKISEFKVILEQELQEVERILGLHLF